MAGTLREPVDELDSYILRVVYYRITWCFHPL